MYKLKIKSYDFLLFITASIFLYNLISNLYKPIAVYLSGLILCSLLIMKTYFAIKNKLNTDNKGEDNSKKIVATSVYITTIFTASLLKSVITDSFIFNLCIIVLIIAAVLLLKFIKEMSKISFISEIKDKIEHAISFSANQVSTLSI